MSKPVCPNCKVEGAMTPPEFKERFKVGDLVTSWSTGKAVKITAIGEVRFLAWDNVHRGGRETVCTMKARWRHAVD